MKRAHAAWPYPYWIAHRGGGTLAPENTLAAFRVGADRGYAAYECDLKLSADGVPYLMHDATLDRTTSGRGPAAGQPWATLSRLDAGGWHAAAWAGEPPASLDAVLQHAAARGHALNLELKPLPGEATRTGAAVAAALLAPGSAAARLALPPLLSSFDVDALAAVAAGAPALPRALLLDTLPPDWLDTARALGCVAVITHHPLMQADLRRQLRDAGLRALCFTVNDPAEVRRLAALGVDGLITDALDRFDPRHEPKQRDQPAPRDPHGPSAPA